MCTVVWGSAFETKCENKVLNIIVTKVKPDPGLFEVENKQIYCSSTYTGFIFIFKMCTLWN